MRIRTFGKFVEVSELQDSNLKDCNVVIDGQNYFYNLYEEFGLPFVFGCEGDKYAAHLKKHLAMYKNSNVKCYIVFKGGHEDKTKALKLEISSYYPKVWATPNRSNENGWNQDFGMVLPIFMKHIYKEVLKEMDIDFVVCEYESKQQCVALAQKLKCPIISFDIEFCFSGVPYIPRNTLKYDHENRSICCGVFKYESFKQKHMLTDEKVAIFIGLRDEQLNIFPDNTFELLFNNIRGLFKRNVFLLKFLAMRTVPEIYKIIYSYLRNSQQQRLFQEEVNRIKEFICKVQTPGVPVEYLLNGKQVMVAEDDPKWFEKGVALGHIGINFVNLYRSDLIRGSWCIEDFDADNAMYLSIDIIAYAHNLLTNYGKTDFLFINLYREEETIEVSLLNSAVRKPEYVAKISPFESGWDRVKHMGLFEHFMTESLGGMDFSALEPVPEDAKILIMALVYFSRRKIDDTTREVYSVLLSYIMLSLVFEKMDKNYKSLNDFYPFSDQSSRFVGKPMDAMTDKDLVSKADCNMASVIMNKYFSSTVSEVILNRKLIHPLVEFQHCLNKLNDLNILCGKAFQPTLYHKTYNGTFVYKFLYAMRNLSRDEAVSFVEKILSPAPSVLAFLKGLVKVYEQIMYR